jgi:hypothetical protein
LARLYGSWFRVETEEGGVGQAISCEEDFEEQACGASLWRGQQLIEWKNFLTRLTPAITTSYFSSAPEGSNFGFRRGRGGAKERATRRSRDKVECSVKTGIFSEDFGKQGGKETAYAAGNFELAISAFSLTIKITQENFIRKNLPWEAIDEVFRKR